MQIHIYTCFPKRRNIIFNRRLGHHHNHHHHHHHRTQSLWECAANLPVYCRLRHHFVNILYIYIRKSFLGLANLYAFSFMNILLAPSYKVRRSRARARLLTILCAHCVHQLCALFIFQMQNLYRKISIHWLKRAESGREREKKWLKFWRRVLRSILVSPKIVKLKFFFFVFFFPRNLCFAFFSLLIKCCWLFLSLSFSLSFCYSWSNRFLWCRLLLWFSSWFVRTKKLIYCSNTYTLHADTHTHKPIG